MQNALVLGTFDGVHTGHRNVIDSVVGYNRLAVTFTIPPKCVFSGKTELLMLYNDKVKALKELGINRIIPLEFCEVCDMGYEEFLDILTDKYNPSAVACGFNYRFGKDAVGNTELLKEYCEKKNISFFCCSETLADGKTLSSTTLRQMIKDGDINIANRYIYGNFGFDGEVMHGDKRGRQIGFPTINQKFPDLLVKPKFGVYISDVFIDGKKFGGITNVGIRPTYRTKDVICETHIFDFCDEIYGKTVKIKLKKFLRSEKKFLSIDELKNQIENDIKMLTFITF
ncbi:MAG: riboflavin biosynthesis protein RibF [Clostridia bacterium]|nr:riboflavin biosynthesis protein RibF [Clostridia bacterium]